LSLLKSQKSLPWTCEQATLLHLHSQTPPDLQLSLLWFCALLWLLGLLQVCSQLAQAQGGNRTGSIREQWFSVIVTPAIRSQNCGSSWTPALHRRLCLAAQRPLRIYSFIQQAFMSPHGVSAMVCGALGKWHWAKLTYSLPFCSLWLMERRRLTE
jgi:hypothetical protein